MLATRIWSQDCVVMASSVVYFGPFKYISAPRKLVHAYLLLHEHAYLYLCVLHQVVLKVRTKPQGDVQAHVHLTPVCPPEPLSLFIHNRVNEICHHLALRLL